MDIVSKLTIDDMNVSLFKIDRIVFQSGISGLSLVSIIRQIDSSANLTIAGGLPIDLTSDNCFFLMPLTAN